jgi:hypothetical protein
MEIRVALEELFARDRRFSVDGPVKRMGFRRMGVQALPVRIYI